MKYILGIETSHSSKGLSSSPRTLSNMNMDIARILNLLSIFYKVLDADWIDPLIVVPLKATLYLLRVS